MRSNRIVGIMKNLKIIDCGWCGTRFTPRAHNTLYCGRICLARAGRRRRNIEAGQQLPETRPCDVCSAYFIPYFEKQWVCSNECRIKSPINWSSRSYTKEQLTKAVKESHSYASLARTLGLSIHGDTNSILKSAIVALGLDTSHFTGQAWNKGKKNPGGRARPIEEYLVKGRKVTTSHFKERLWREGLLPKHCQMDGCNISEWMGKPAPLALDHINGDKFDNRLDNLRILCHNCHAQTDTFCSKNKVKNSEAVPHSSVTGPYKHLRDSVVATAKATLKVSNTCNDCSKQISYNAERCKSCAGKFQNNTKINWPDSNTLQKMVSESSYLRVSKGLGVSDNAIRKRLKNHPPQLP